MPAVLNKKKSGGGRSRPEPSRDAPKVPPPNPPPLPRSLEALAEFASRGAAAQKAVDELGAGRPREPSLDEVRDLERIHKIVLMLRADPEREKIQRVLTALAAAAHGTPQEYTWNKLLHLTWDESPGGAPR